MALTKVTYAMIEGAAFNVEDYGADKTGVADSKDAINLAFAAMEAAGGGTIYLPKGTYYISGTVGNQTNPSAEISFAIVGEPGTVINCNPAVYANRALNLYYDNLNTVSVKNLIIQCNTKTCVGIYLRSTAIMKCAEIDACEVYNCHAVNNAGVTDSVFGIFVYSDAWSYAASVTNCFVQNVTRAKTGLACQAINIRGFVTTFIANNSVENVRHSNQSGDIQDADGIVVFSYQNGSGNYSKSTATIIGNQISNCEGRCVKLQTNGAALVENNYMLVEGSLVLIGTWHAIDSQVGDSTIRNNTIKVSSGWTGGVSASVFGISPPVQANVDYNYEGFYNRIIGNNVESLVTLYGIVQTGFAANCTATSYLEISDNTVNWPTVFTTTTEANNVAAAAFIITENPPSVANTTGQVVWKIHNNYVFTYNFIEITGTQADYSDKWYFYVYDNIKTPMGYAREIFYLGKTRPYTSTCMIRDNQMGGAASSSQLTWPVDLVKIYNGSDFYTGDQTLTNAPAGYTFSRVYKKGTQWGVQRSNQYYISGDASTWTTLV